jgi:hypothetical protein
LRRFAPLLVLIVVAAGCGTTTTRHDFRLDAETISSIAAEGSLFAEDVADGSTTNAFARVHGGELADTAEELRLTLLRSTAAKGLRARELASVAHRVSSRLETLSKRPPRGEAERLGQELEQLSDAAAKLAEDV